MDWAPLGDSAWFCKTQDQIARDGVLRLHAALVDTALDGVTDIVISYDSLAVHFAPEHGASVRKALKQLDAYTTVPTQIRTRTFEIPTDYNYPSSEIANVAEQLHLSVEEVIRRHAAPEYEVAAIGFSPGFPYLTGLDESLFLPRKHSPSTVPRGAVAIAGSQAGIYPNESHGGWHVLGVTNHRLFSTKSGSLLRPSDRVRFVATSLPQVPTEDQAQEVTATSPPCVEVLGPGPFSSIQDLGRPGFRADGVSAGGSLDPVVHFVTNRLVGNGATCAAIECAGGGPLLRLLQPCTVAWHGWAEGSGRPHTFQPGDLLDLRTRMSNAIGTIAFSGGIDVPLCLDSRSTDVRAGFGGIHGRRLLADDQFALGQAVASPPRPGPWHVSWPETPDRLHIRFLPGMQSDWFAESTHHDFQSRLFKKSPRFDRTGMRLEGHTLNLAEAREMKSQPVVTGSIQVPPDGNPIILLSECQTIGGYPQIGHVISADLPKLARALPGTRIQFRQVDLEIARQAWQDLRQEMGKIEAAISLRP